MISEVLAALRARPITLIVGTAMVTVAIAAMVLIPTLTRSASAKVLADLDTLGSDAWTVAPQAAPGETARIPPGGLARVSDVPGVTSAVLEVATTLTVARNPVDVTPSTTTLIGVDTTPGSPVTDATAGVRRPVPGYAFALAGRRAVRTLDITSFPTTVVVSGTPIVVTGSLRGDPLLPELNDAVVTDSATALTIDPVNAVEQLVVRTSVDLTPGRLRQSADPLDLAALSITRPKALVAARGASTTTLTGLTATASITAFAVAALAVAVMLTSAVRQRTAELAVRRVHGARQASILALVCSEGLAIGVIGSVTGTVLSNATIIAVLAATGWPPQVSIGLQGLAIVTAMFMTMTASVPPSLVALRIQPARAFAVE